MTVGPALDRPLTRSRVGRSRAGDRIRRSALRGTGSPGATVLRPHVTNTHGIRSHVTTLGSGNQDNSVGLDFPESAVIKDDRVSRVTAPC